MGKGKKIARKALPLFALMLPVLLLSSCQQTAPEEQFQPLLSLLEKQGWEYTLEPLSQRDGESVPVPIYDQSVWHRLRVGTEEWLVYFDSSNRAKYLVEKFCSGDAFGKTIYVGLRFVVCYEGTNEEILGLMEEWQEAYPA